jgi:DNA adenine methylase
MPIKPSPDLQKPFLKWPGGKIRVVPKLLEVLPRGTRLIEPFVGSGAVFLNADYPQYFLADTNQDLINLFGHIQREGESFIDFCRPWFGPMFNDTTVFYALREAFNTATDSRLRAALFLYLNKHCFNGLVRFNNKGLFNTPFGAFKQVTFPEDALRAFQAHTDRAEFACQDFTVTMKAAIRGDVVYCDPPYVPLTTTANFTKFGRVDFGLDEQRELARLAKWLAEKKGVAVVISNHDTKFITDEYRSAELHRISVRRSISRDGATRGDVAEIVAVFRP